MKIITKLITVLAFIIGVGVLFTPTMAGAVNVYEPCTPGSTSKICNSTGDQADSIIKIVVNIMIYAIGIVAVIVIIISGYTFTTANGKQEQITKARQTLTYAIVGLVIAILAYAIVNWVLQWIT